MPNWCENRVYIEASEAEIVAICDAVARESLLAYLYPEPNHDADSRIWRTENWGTKWEVDATVFSHGDTWMNIAFDSAWSPPIDALKHWHKQDPEHRKYNIRYIEWGMGFCGESDSDGTKDTFNIPSTVALAEATISMEINEEFGISDTIAQWEKPNSQTA